MSESATISITIFECPAEHVGQVIDLLREHLFNYSTRPSWQELTTLMIDDTMYADIEAGTLDRLAEDLASLGVTFLAFTEPVGEFAGDLYINVPDLGLFNSECDGNGNATIPAYRLLELADEATDLDELKATLNERLGRAWSDTIKPLLERTDVRVLTRDGSE